MSQRDEQWGPEEEPVVRRLREERPQLSAFELDRIKTGVMAKAKPTPSPRRPWRRGVQSRFAVAALTLGLMGAGTAGAVASSSGSAVVSDGTGAATSQYYPCLHHLDHFFLCACLHGHILACIIYLELHHYPLTENKVSSTDTAVASASQAGG